MSQIIHIKPREVIIYEVTDQYLKECQSLKKEIKNKTLYLQYFENCEYENIVLDKSQCIFSGKWITHNMTKKSDGDWLWTADLEHYFEHYNFLWPEEHQNKIQLSNFELSEDSKLILKKRYDLGAILYKNASHPSDVNPFNDLIIQNKVIKKIKLTSLKT